jgi:ABC-type phosphate transport system substrate-binding protein
MKKSMIFAAVFCALLPTAASASDERDVAVIVNAANPVSDISMQELRELLLGERKTWNRRSRVVVLLRKSGAAEREAVLEKACGMNEQQFKQHWGTKIFRGEAATEPAAVQSHGVALDYVANLDGAISFVDAGQVQARVKVLKIDGKLPGQAGYPLR